MAAAAQIVGDLMPERTRTKITAICLVLASLGLLVTACGNDDSSEQSTQTQIVTKPEKLDSSDYAEIDTEKVTEKALRKGIEAQRTFAAKSKTDAWALSDSLQPVLDEIWNDTVGAYVSGEEKTSTRLNASLLAMHVASANAGHNGPSRNDERARKLVDFLVGPAFLDTLKGVKLFDSRHNKPHVPGWRQSSSAVVNQHPGIDAVAASALADAYRGADQLGLSFSQRSLIRKRIISVAKSKDFRPPARLLNQINWNADLYAAAQTVDPNGNYLSKSYRSQLHWFAYYAYRGRNAKQAPNLSQGNGFYYVPGASKSQTENRSDTVEYANIVLGALSYYDQAIQQGMRPLLPGEQTILRNWAQRTVNASWTPSGFLNWDTGKGARRIYLRQYWALALQGATGAQWGAANSLGLSKERGNLLLSRANQLFRRWSEQEKNVLVDATAYGFSSAFETVADNRLTTTVRLASLLASWAERCGCSGALPQPDAATPLDQQSITFDSGFKRLAVNGSHYSTAVVPPSGTGIGGGLEPLWILDQQGRQLASLGGGGDGSFGLAVKGDQTLTDTQPASGAWNTALTLKPDSSGSGTKFVGETKTSEVAVKVQHDFQPTKIVTRYEITPQTPRIRVTLRFPSAMDGGEIVCVNEGQSETRPLPGCKTSGAYLAGFKDLQHMLVSYKGIPENIGLGLSIPTARQFNPKPGQQAQITFIAREPVVIERTIEPQNRD